MGRVARLLPGPSPAARPAAWRAVLIALVAVAAGDVGAVVTVTGRSAPARAGFEAREVAGPGTGVGGPGPYVVPPAGVPTGVGLPRLLEIPSLGIQTGLLDLGLGPDGALGAPDDPATAGWWSQGTRPGDAGPAVIVGHVDSYTGPAVFFRLSQLKAGDAVSVTRDDGKVVTFVVDEVQQYKKAELPTALVYGPTAAPTLRLITCGGRFDRRERSYESNVVVFAHEGDSATEGGRS